MEFRLKKFRYDIPTNSNCCPAIHNAELSISFSVNLSHLFRRSISQFCSIFRQPKVENDTHVELSIFSRAQSFITNLKQIRVSGILLLTAKKIPQYLAYYFWPRRKSRMCMWISALTTRRFFFESSHNNPFHSRAKSQAASKTSC